LSSCVDAFFHAAAEAEKFGQNLALPLSREVAAEKLAATNIAVPYQQKTYASDAPLGLGLVVSTTVSLRT
jgi:hypothetical protein